MGRPQSLLHKYGRYFDDKPDDIVKIGPCDTSALEKALKELTSVISRLIATTVGTWRSRHRRNISAELRAQSANRTNGVRFLAVGETTYGGCAPSSRATSHRMRTSLLASAPGSWRICSAGAIGRCCASYQDRARTSASVCPRTSCRTMRASVGDNLVSLLKMSNGVY